MDAMELGILIEIPDIRKKACRKLFKQQENNRSKLLSSYKDMVTVVTQMVYVSKSMSCYLKGTSGTPLVEFSCVPGNQNEAGDCDGIPVFTFWSIFDFEKLAEELVQMFVSETNIKRLLVMEICSIVSKYFSQVDRLKWSDHFYDGELDDLGICNSNSNEVAKQLVPRADSCISQSTTMQSSNQLERNVLQILLDHNGLFVGYQISLEIVQDSKIGSLEILLLNCNLHFSLQVQGLFNNLARRS